MPTLGDDLKLVDRYVRSWRKADIGRTVAQRPLLTHSGHYIEPLSFAAGFTRREEMPLTDPPKPPLQGAEYQGIRVRAIIRLIPTGDGGRSLPISGCYRPNHNFFAPDNREMATGFIDFPDGVYLYPGDSLETEIAFWPWERLAAEIRPGREWRIQEGAKLVGFGIVLEVLQGHPATEH